MRAIILLCLAALFLGAEPAAGDADAKKKFLVAIGKSLKAADAAAIGKLFPESGTIRLTLRGVKSGKYRATQAKSLLKTWFKTIEPKKCELKDTGRTFGKYSMKYKVKADATTVTKTVHVHLQKEGESWLIVGIVES